MHMNLQQWNEANAIAVLVLSTFAVVIPGFLGALLWEAGTQKADWCARVVALGFWFLGGSFIASAIGLFLDTFHWVSPAQNNFLEHIESALWIFSLTVLLGGVLIGSLMNSIADKKR